MNVAWERNPVSVHGSKEELQKLLDHLRREHQLQKHSLIMPDRESDEVAVFFIYQSCDPKWFMELK
jgi:hypothetical protein